MSVYRFVHWAASQRTGSGPRKAVLNTLAMMADWQTGRCEAKIETLMEYTELSDGCIRQHLRALEVAGVIAKRHQYRRDGTRRGSEFLILAPGVGEWPDGEQLPSRDDGYQPAGDDGHIRQEMTGDPAGDDGQEQPLKEQPLKNPTSTKSDVDRVWERYLAARKTFRPRSNGCKLGDVEKRIIREALKVRATDDVLAAVEGLFKSEWHTTNEYLGINYALRGGSRSPVPGATIDRMAALARGQANGNGRRLKDRTYRGLAWDELTPHAQASAKEAAAMGLEVWDGGKDSWEGAEERRAAAAAATAERRRNGTVPAGAWTAETFGADDD